MRGSMDPEQVFRTLPGIGAALAHRIQTALEADSLAELAIAAHDGRLAAVDGIGPRRLNPSGEAWLPIRHTQRDAWHFTALFSNTARAHQLGRSREWVVSYFHSDHEPESQCTVVTESQGVLAGRCVVRGREAERRAHYAARPAHVD
jgi:hypothetical protein